MSYYTVIDNRVANQVKLGYPMIILLAHGSSSGRTIARDMTVENSHNVAD